MSTLLASVVGRLYARGILKRPSCKAEETMRCPICGSAIYQQVLEEWPSSKHIRCGVCSTQYGVKKRERDVTAEQDAQADLQYDKEREERTFGSGE